MTVLTLREVVDGFRELGIPLQLAGVPVLVCCSGPVKDSPLSGYETTTLSQAWDQRVALAVFNFREALLDATLLMKCNAIYPIRKGPNRPFPERIGVGRAHTTDVHIRQASISKYHAYFEIAGDKTRICDAKSANGTLMDGESLVPGAPVDLKEGSHIVLGGEQFLFFSASSFETLVKKLA